MILICLTVTLWGGNSIFSYYGPSCQNYGNDVYGITMGNTGVSDVFRKNTGYGNPAVLGSSNKTLLSTGLLFGWTNYQSDDGTKRSFRDNSLDFPFFSVAIPLANHHLGFQFNSMASGVLENKTAFTVDSLNVTEKQSIDRYIYRADLLYAMSFKNFNLGMGFNYYFGHDIRKFYQNSGFGIFNTSEKLERSYKNPTATLGFTAKYNKLSVGAAYTQECTLSGDEIRSSIHETEDLGSIKYSIPSQFSLGVTTLITDEFKITTEYGMELWESAAHTEYSKNSWKLGAGFAHDPTPDTRKTFLGSLPKRIGFSYRALPFDVNGNSIRETVLSGGISVPIKHSDNQLDFGMQYVIRGDIGQNKLQDRAVMFMLGITGFDIITGGFDRTSPRDIPVSEETSE